MFVRALCAALAFGASSAYAALTFAGGVLYDGATGLDWLALDSYLMRGTTWDRATAFTPPGFRYATSAEAATFFADAGIVGTSGPGGNTAVQILLHDWGALTCCHGGQSSLFWLADPGEPGRHAVGALIQTYSLATGEFNGWTADPLYGFLPDNEPGSYLSAALVRPHALSAPEPGIWALLLVTMPALLVRRLRGTQRR